MFSANWSWTGIGAFAAGLLVTLVLASRLTPGHWWRRPNARALAVLVGGTWVMGSALLWLAPAPGRQAAAAPMPAPRPIATPTPTSTPAPRPIETPAPPAPDIAATPPAPRSYRVVEALNLRASGAVAARRIGVVAAGSQVTATGARDGDWWQVRADIKGKAVTGWASSLWLRRRGE